MTDEMIYEACVEVRPDGTAFAQLRDMPAAFALGNDETDAVAALEESLPGYFAWLSRHDEYTPVVQGRGRVAVVEALRLADPTVGAYFQSDAEPFTAEDLDWYAALLDWSYADMAGALGRFSPPAWDASVVNGQSPRAVALNTAGRQLWLLSRLGMVTASDTPPSPTDAPADTIRRAHDTALARFRAIQKEMYDQIADRDGERWSLRKLLRRSILLVRSASADLERAGLR